MLDARYLETPVSHLSDRILFYDATGFFSDNYFRPIQQSLKFALSKKPRDLTLKAKRAEFALFRQQPDGMRQLFAGRAEAADMSPPSEPIYTVEGVVSDNAAIYNPRFASVQAGNRAEHRLALYRSPGSTRIPPAGAVTGNVVYENGSPASWAVLTVVVTPTLGSPLSFRAQADVHGDFIVPLNRMPAINKDAPASTYSAELSVVADGVSGGSISRPSTHVAYQVGTIETDTDTESFALTAVFSVTPGGRLRLASASHERLVIKST